MVHIKSSSSTVFLDLTNTIGTMADQITLTMPATLSSTSASFGLADPLTCKTSAETTNIVPSLAIDKIKYENYYDDLTRQIIFYLTLLGVEKVNILAFMLESTWHMPASLSRADLDILKVSIISILYNVAGYTAHIKEMYILPLNFHHLRQVDRICRSAPQPARNDARGSADGNVGASVSSEVNITSFSIPILGRDSLGGGKFINNFATKCRSNAHIKYLTNEQFCIKTPRGPVPL